MRRFIMVLSLLSLIVSVSSCFELKKLREYRRIINEIEIEDVDLTGLSDGVYHGSQDALLVSAEVWVTISGNEITNIELKHDHGRGEKAESIIDTVQEKQTLKVDLITGATSSSKVILKAIENALRSEPDSNG